MHKQRITKAQHEQDSLVLGTIIAGSQDKKLIPNDINHEHGCERETSVCAIGGSNKGKGVNKVSDIFQNSWKAQTDERHNLIPLIRFSTSHNVSDDYACGVNDGFEGETGIAKSFYEWVNEDSPDYSRGWHVGQAARIQAGY